MNQPHRSEGEPLEEGYFHETEEPGIEDSIRRARGRTGFPVFQRKPKVNPEESRDSKYRPEGGSDSPEQEAPKDKKLTDEQKFKLKHPDGLDMPDGSHVGTHQEYLNWCSTNLNDGGGSSIID